MATTATATPRDRWRSTSEPADSLVRILQMTAAMAAAALIAMATLLVRARIELGHWPVAWTPELDAAGNLRFIGDPRAPDFGIHSSIVLLLYTLPFIALPVVAVVGLLVFGASLYERRTRIRRLLWTLAAAAGYALLLAPLWITLPNTVSWLFGIIGD